MGRTVSAWVTSGADYLGVVGPFAVDVPWWAEVEPVIAYVQGVLDVEVLVLRLLRVDGGEGGRDGHVTYHVEALRRPAPGLLTRRPIDEAALTRPERLRSPWARVAGLREVFGWATELLAAAGRPVTGPIRQRKTWNLAGLFLLPTDRGTVWLKTTPHFAADEGAVIGAFANLDPGLVPTVIAAGPGRVLLEHLPGEDCWDASVQAITSAVTRMVAAQSALAGPAGHGLAGPAGHGLAGPAGLGFAGPAGLGLRDLRGSVIAGQVRDLLAGPVGRELTAEELAGAHRLVERWPMLDECGLPDTIVHGDFHSGNWRSDGGPPVVVDFADAHLGNPVLDGVRVCDFLPETKRPAAARAWIDAWTSQVPGCDPARALSVAEPLAHLSYAVRYQEFLDGIEPSERIYHLGDPATVIRAALRVRPAWPRAGSLPRPAR
ncbi:aminoglycoside phosphotransferase family protein [Nonomuraea guangzhouensis]|uniref:Aminoglycoside phosphotransferase family protein n=1 Tax=Nonomuraea guangzhouensis TaxID=1291555 RepID=A0ABW4GEM4_9ACTN|nr:aminoglycoside phosphotransferase family protein [Nonomuraea guangzhouensis]